MERISIEVSMLDGLKESSAKMAEALTEFSKAKRGPSLERAVRNLLDSIYFNKGAVDAIIVSMENAKQIQKNIPQSWPTEG